MVYDVKTLNEICFDSYANVFVVQKTKKTPGVIEKINVRQALVKMRHTI